ncbi:hypothetical protein PIB30_024595 [Stylosanthes scabra]|uniref:Uncharacterized protein n=1 Tax=Stylosanthes scabra TaxID=79078 RepID=A0ABU6VAM9_9FABA|nr:hypothetical protein [Stylosanthes scabra]
MGLWAPDNTQIANMAASLYHHWFDVGLCAPDNTQAANKPDAHISPLEWWKLHLPIQIYMILIKSMVPLVDRPTQYPLVASDLVAMRRAALLYSVISKFVFTKQYGNKDAGVAQFVILKWEMRIIGSTFIFQSTIDPPLAKRALVSFAVVYLVIKCLNTWPFISSRYEGSVNARTATADTDEFMRGIY